MVSKEILDAGKAFLGPSRVYRLGTAADLLATRARSWGTADGRASSRTLTAFHNRYRGQRAVIIGNGPSLRVTELALLEHEFTFGLNRGYLLFDELGFNSTFLVAINDLLIRQVAGELADVRSRTFLRWNSRKSFDHRLRTPTFLQSRRGLGFATDVRGGLWEGATVTYVAMQLAFHMGFSKVILIGVDHNFVTQGPAGQTVESSGPDPNHFDPNYFGSGFLWQLPDLDRSERAYRLARAAYEADDRAIVDATVGGHLSVYPKATLAAALR